MNICKSSGISARTKSLREKFSSKRSFSELSFAAPSTSTSSLAASESSCQTRSGSFRSPRSSRYRHAGNRPDSPLSSRLSREKEITSEIIKVATGSTSDYTSFLPEDAYCSALDINCQIDGEPRFPWQRDVAIQCDLIPTPLPHHHHHPHHHRGTPQILVDPDSPVSVKKSFGAKTVNRVASFLDHHSHHKSASSVHQVSSATASAMPSPSSVVSVHPAASHLLFPSTSSASPSNLKESSSTSAIPSGGTPVTPQPHKKYSHFAGLRFWKSSNTLTPEEQALQQQLYQQQQQQQQVKQKQRHKSSYNSGYKNVTSAAKKSVLQRAVSFDSRGYSKLVSNDSLQSLDQASQDVIRSDPTTRIHENDHLYLVDTSHDDLLLSPSKSEMTILPSGSILIPPPPTTPESRFGSPLPGGGGGDGSSSGAFDQRSASNLEERRMDRTGDQIEVMDSLRNRRELFTKKPNSAPDSFDNGSSPESPTSDIRSDQGFVTSSRRHHRKNLRNQSHIFTFETMQKLFDLKMRAKASESMTINPAAAGLLPAFPIITTNEPGSVYPDHQCELSSVAASVATGSSGPGSGSYTKPSLLEIPSTASLPTGQTSKGVHGYMSLPSPNVPTEGSETITGIKKLLGDESEVEEVDQEEPPASVLHSRRQALVPPKLITDDYESANDDLDQCSTGRQSSNFLSEPRDKHRRRSSIVVIPPMQICPGDLLVYSKDLNTQSHMYLGDSQHSLSVYDANRKGKNTWSLLKLFDRSSRGKSDSLCGLEEVLSNMTPSVFVDEQLSKYKGLGWCDFLSMFEERRTSSTISGQRLSSVLSDHSNSSESRRSSALSSGSQDSQQLQHQTPTTMQSKSSSEVKDLRRQALQRHQTFDSTTSDRTNAETEEHLLTAHSTRSHSCIAPVDISIRRLSGGMNLKEESSFDLAEADRLTPTGAQKVKSVEPDDHMVLLEPTSPSLLASGVTPMLGSMRQDTITSRTGVSIMSSTRSSFAVSRSEQKRREALWDLFQSECAFMYDHLMVLKNVFMEPLKKIQVEGFAMFAEPEVLFGNLDELCCVTYAFCKEFLSVILQQMNQYDINATEALVRLFQKSSKAASLTQAYHRYTLNYINALNYLETLRRQVEFNEFEKWCSRDPRCKKLQLTDLLVSPVQHVMRVPLILKDIESRTEDLNERETITNIIEAEEASLRELDDKMKWLKNFERLLEIQRNIQWPPVIELDPKVYIPDFLRVPLAKQPCERLIVSPRRQIILEGALNLLDSGKPVEMYLILFDDMFVITRRKKGLSKKQSSLTEKWATSCGKAASSCAPHDSLFKYVVYKQPLSLDRFYIHDVTAQEAAASNLKCAFVLVCLNRFQQIITCHTFQAPNDPVKMMWLTRLRDTADRWKRTLQNSVFRSQQRLSTTSTISAASSAIHTRSSSIATQATNRSMNKLSIK